MGKFLAEEDKGIETFLPSEWRVINARLKRLSGILPVVLTVIMPSCRGREQHDIGCSGPLTQLPPLATLPSGPPQPDTSPPASASRPRLYFVAHRIHTPYHTRRHRSFRIRSPVATRPGTPGVGASFTPARGIRRVRPLTGGDKPRPYEGMCSRQVATREDLCGSAWQCKLSCRVNIPCDLITF
jgi:hypothetical protein